MGSDKFEVVAVNIDTGDDEKPKAFLERDRRARAWLLSRQHRWASSTALKKEGLAFGLPVTLLIDDKGLPDLGDERPRRMG